MQRRDFLKSTALVSSMAALGSLSTTHAATATPRQFFEWRHYRMRMGPMARRFTDYTSQALVPALKRLGIGPVGVFQTAHGSDSPSFYVLIPYRSLEQMAEVRAQLVADEAYRTDGTAFLNALSTDPSYESLESSLFVGFEGMPAIEVPPADMPKSRLFELRTYQSHSAQANRKKIEMFNQGEIEIFRKTGLRPVFFGEAIAGAQLPNLTYLLVFDDMAAREKHWGEFIAHPDWKALSAKPEYANAAILSRISNLFLRSGPGSEL
jgi:hypothetical protein